MKTRFALTILISVFAFNLSFAGGIKDPKKARKEHVKAEVTNLIGFPEFAIENNRQADVYISFKVEENGNIFVNEVNSADVDFKMYVEKRLSEMTVDTEHYEIGKDYKMKISFRLL